MNKGIIVFICFLLFEFCFFNLAAENAKLKLQVVPAIYEAEIRSGENISFDITLKNIGDKEITLSGNVFSLKIEEDGSPVIVNDPYLSHSCQNWIQFNPKSLLVKPNEKRQIRVLINSPKEARGGYYAAILFEITDKEKRKTPQVSFALRTGTMIAVLIKNSKKLDAEINSFSFSNKDSETIFEIKFDNKSNVHIKPEGSVIIYDNKNRVIDRINISKNNFISPHSMRTFKLIWKNSKKKQRNRVELYTAECRLFVKGLNKKLSEKLEFLKIYW